VPAGAEELPVGAGIGGHQPAAGQPDDGDWLAGAGVRAGRLGAVGERPRQRVDRGVLPEQGGHDGPTEHEREVGEQRRGGGGVEPVLNERPGRVDAPRLDVEDKGEPIVKEVSPVGLGGCHSILGQAAL